MRALALVMIAAGCATSPGAASGDDDTSTDTVSAACQAATEHDDLAWIQANIFTPSCAVSGCHTGPATDAGHLSLEAEVAASSLVGVPATTQSGWMRVVAGDAATSYLVVAIGQAPGPAPKDGTMPAASPELCSQKRAAIERWVAAGAEE